MLIDILSLFPDYFTGPFDVSMIKRAREKGLLEIKARNIRDFARGKHRQVDDRPYGGGPGMVLMAEPVVEAIRAYRTPTSHVVHLTPQGKTLTPKIAQGLSEKKHLIFLCGHYEGIDARADKEVDEEISIGDYVLSNGCAAAIVVIDALARYLPEVLGNEESAACDSFEEGIFDAPHYTRPEVFEGESVPAPLREGNHAVIAAWRKEQAIDKTKKVRPELLGAKE